AASVRSSRPAAHCRQPTERDRKCNDENHAQPVIRDADWNTVINIWRAGAKDPSAKGATAINYSYFIQDPFTALISQSQ
ncbi:hypothetical protein ACC754_43830, partial [Rhizobium johnstonii]